MRIVLLLTLSIILLCAYASGQGAIPEIRRVDNILEFLASRPELKAEIQKKIEKETVTPQNAATTATAAAPKQAAETQAEASSDIDGPPKHRFGARRGPN